MRTMRFTLLTAVALASLLTLTTQALATGNQIEGLWDVVVTITNCATGLPLGVPPFPGTIMFTRHGQIIETAGTPLVGPPLPQQRLMPGLGSWQRLGRRHFTASFSFFRVHVPSVAPPLPPGAIPFSFAGTQTITEDIELSHDGNEFTSIGTSQIFPATGPPLDLTCNALTGTRRD